MTQGNSLMI